jgi:hypothetical protein
VLWILAHVLLQLLPLLALHPRGLVVHIGKEMARVRRCDSLCIVERLDGARPLALAQLSRPRLSAGAGELGVPD